MGKSWVVATADGQEYHRCWDNRWPSHGNWIWHRLRCLFGFHKYYPFWDNQPTYLVCICCIKEAPKSQGSSNG